MSDLKQDNENSKLETDKRRGNVILRQELNNLTPHCNIKCAVICNLFLSLLFFAFGVPLMVFHRQIESFELDYTDW